MKKLSFQDKIFAFLGILFILFCLLGKPDSVSFGPLSWGLKQSIPDRHLTIETKACFLRKLKDLNTKSVSLEQRGGFDEFSNGNTLGLVAAEQDEETVDFTSELASFLKNEGYKVDPFIEVEDSITAEDPVFKGVLVQASSVPGETEIIIGKNDGSIPCSG